MTKSTFLNTTMVLASAFSVGLMANPAQADMGNVHDILENYANIAHAGFEDSLTTAEALKVSVDAFLENPNAETLAQARSAWLASRVPYQQTEAFRFGNAIVDDWEGRVNAWPLDEGLIDYVDVSYGAESDENGLYAANVIANADLLINGKATDVSVINPTLLGEVLHEAAGVEANVASGYHAAEFMLWGQDLNGTGAGAGNRLATDFSLTECTNGNCDRRRDYLSASIDLLIADLEEMVANWTADGAARASVLEDESAGLSAILTGMGSLSYGELAGERMKLGLLLHDPEEEHDCFSDNTHNSHFYDAKGIQNVYLGRYVRVDGSVIEGPSLAHFVAHKDEALNTELEAGLSATMDKMGVMVARAEAGEAYDQMIGEGNEEGNAVVQAAIDALVDQTQSIERIVALLDLDSVTIEGSDSLTAPESVFQ